MTTIDHSSIELFKQHLAQRGRQPATVESYARDCSSFLDFLHETGVNAGDIAPDVFLEFQEHLGSRGIRGNSVRRTVIGVRQFFRFLQDRYQWDRSPLDDAPIPEREDSFSNRVSDDVFVALIQSAHTSSPDIKRYRDVAILMLLGIEGLKVHEMIALDWKDFMYSTTHGILTIHGDRSRSINLESDTSEALRTLRQISEEARPSLTNAASKIMLGFKGSTASVVIPNLTRHGVKFALYELGNQIKLPQLNSEELRHHAMGHKVAIGFSPEQLMNHLGLRTIGKTAAHFAAAH